MSKSSAAKHLQKLADQIPDDTAVWESLQHHDDTPWAHHLVALVAAAYVDHALEVAVIASMTKLTDSERKGLFNFESNGPLADLSAKIKIARALDVIGPETRSDLDHIRYIRNAFAHSLQPIGFDTEQVAAVCELLKAHNRLTLLARWSFGTGAKDRYINSALSIGSDLKAGLKTKMVMHAGRAFPIRVLP